MDQAVGTGLTAQNLEHFLEFLAHLLDDLLALRVIRSSLFTSQLLPGAADREAVVVQQAANLTDDDDILTLIIASVATPFDGLELWKFLLPIPEYVRLDGAQVANLTYGEIALTRYGRKFAVIPRFQHMILLGLLVFVPDGTSQRDVR